MHVYTYSVGLPCGMYVVTWHNHQSHMLSTVQYQEWFPLSLVQVRQGSCTPYLKIGYLVSQNMTVTEHAQGPVHLFSR